MGKLEGRIAIVTGGSRGIGEAIAGALLSEGAVVVVTGRKEKGLEEAAARLSTRGRVIPIASHAGDAEAIAALVARVTDEVGLCDILVNNAATNPYFGPLMTVEAAAWDKTFDVNLKGTFEMTRQVCRRLIDANRPGSIVNLSSIYGTTGAPLQGVYAMTKAALISLTRTLAVELGPSRIRVNAIAPGLVDTKFAFALTSNPALSRVFTDRAPLGRIGKPEEVAGIACWLATDEASFVTGQTFVVDGGYSIA